MTAKKPMKVVGYSRVSTTGQAQDGHSLKAQESAIRRWAKQQGYEVLGVYSDAGKTGTKLKDRDGLETAVAVACEHAAIFAVYSLSRATRSMKDACELIDRLGRCKAHFVSITEPLDSTTAMGRAMFNIAGTFAQLESDMVSERTTAVLQERRRQGKRISRHIPFGYSLAADGESLEAIPAEQKALQYMRKLRSEGRSLRDIGKQLMMKGYSPKTAKVWSATSIKQILARMASESE